MKTELTCSGLELTVSRQTLVAAFRLPASLPGTSLSRISYPITLMEIPSPRIHPDYNLYKLADIKSAIAEGIGAEPVIRCSRGPFKKFQLFEVHICIDSDGSTIIECPVKPKFTCTEEILFHPFRSWMLNDTTKAFETNSNIRMPIDKE
ncbi:hypothetical protein KFK09_000018 [Dendrobium nobile]|uniref:Uncharacterized protein n=1 Tax=Dendrobium nobile TaxID=94219 RepID=A0A8T3C7C3_DENNO|nr:hypothetical protein KFK09_000018 [Dendrobium nobile]